MNETFSRFIQLVIQNNPVAISQKLRAIGILNQEMEDAEYIRQVLYDQVRRIGEDGSELILQVLDVPLNPEGFGATELMNFYATVGNRSLLTNFFRQESEELNFIPIDSNSKWFDLELILKIMGIGVLILTGIGLLKYLFKS